MKKRKGEGFLSIFGKKLLEKRLESESTDVKQIFFFEEVILLLEKDGDMLFIFLSLGGTMYAATSAMPKKIELNDEGEVVISFEKEEVGLVQSLGETLDVEKEKKTEGLINWFDAVVSPLKFCDVFTCLRNEEEVDNFYGLNFFGFKFGDGLAPLISRTMQTKCTTTTVLEFQLNETDELHFGYCICPKCEDAFTILWNGASVMISSDEQFPIAEFDYREGLLIAYDKEGKVIKQVESGLLLATSLLKRSERLLEALN